MCCPAAAGGTVKIELVSSRGITTKCYIRLMCTSEYREFEIVSQVHSLASPSLCIVRDNDLRDSKNLALAIAKKGKTTIELSMEEMCLPVD